MPRNEATRTVATAAVLILLLIPGVLITLQPYLYPLFILKIISILLGVYYYNLFNTAYRLLLLHAILSISFEAFGQHLKSGSQTNTWLFNIFNLADMWLLAITGLYFLKNVIFRKTMLVLLCLLTLHWAYNFLWLGHTELFNLFMVSSSLLLITIYTKVLLTNLLFKQLGLLASPLFLMCLSIIFAYGCTIPLFGMLNYFIKHDLQLASDLFYINYVVNLVRYTLVSIAFYLYGQQAKRGYVQQ